MKFLPAVLATVLSLAMSQLAQATVIKVVSGSAFKQVLNALAAEYRKETGTRLDITYRTVGQHLASIRAGQEPFDVAILTPDAIDTLAKQDKIAPGTRVDLAKTGIGVMVKAEAPAPDIATVDAFKRALLAAKSVAFIDPKAGGSSGIYIEGLDQVNAKAVLIHGGAVADYVAGGQAEIGIHQISEILPVADVKLVGPLPAEIQNFTVYGAGVGAAAKDGKAAREFIKFLAGPNALRVVEAKGMEAAS